jgi:protein SCO1/2
MALVMLAIFFAFVVSKSLRTDPPLPVYATVADFSLTNQFGRLISLSDLQGKVWVADIIFTRCPGPCWQMTKRMSDLQATLPANAPVQLVSLTADPAFDTPEVLKRYGERFGAAGDRWYFLTGKKPDVYRLATKGLLLFVDEVKPEQRESENDLLEHSELFVVMDKQARIRATFPGAESSSRQKILKTIQVLLKEKQP